MSAPNLDCRTGLSLSGGALWPLRRLVGTPYAVVRIALGLLVAAAGLKAHQLATQPVAEAGLFGSRWFLIAQVEGEFLFGLWLLAGLWPQGTRRLALVCFSAFAAVSLDKALTGEATCGCFGRVQVNPWYTLALDLGAVAALFLTRPRRGLPQRSPRAVKARLAALACLGLAVGLPALALLATGPQTAVLGEDGRIRGNGRVVVLEPEKWIGKRFPLLDHIDIGGRLLEGFWMVILYRQGCPKCRGLIAERRATAEDGYLPGGWRRVAFIALPPYQDSVRQPSGSCSSEVVGYVCAVEGSFVSAPLEVQLVDGAVVAALSEPN